MSIAASGSPATTGTVTGLSVNTSGYTTVGQSMVGLSVTPNPAVTNTGAGTYNYTGMQVTSPGAIIQNTGAGADNYYGANIAMPAITQTTGAVNSYGDYIKGGTVTSGNEYGIYFDNTSGNFTNILSTNQANINVFNANATTVSAFGAATTLTMGAAGTSTMNLIAQNFISSVTSINVFNTTSTTVSAFGAATTLGIDNGSAVATIGIGNASATALNLAAITTTVAGTTINLNAATVNSNAASLTLFGSPTTVRPSGRLPPLPWAQPVPRP